MTGEPLLYAALVVMAALHLLAAWYGARRGHGGAGMAPGTDPDRATAGDADASGDGAATGPAGEPDSGAGDAATEDAADLVACRHCGTLNERGYARCRDCVGELPGADGRARPARPTGGSLLR